ncbi:MAG: acyltransferase family protein, partial [Promethearchaeota archaeon]
ILTIFAILDQGFFMALFFFISAYFVPGSYDRKGARRFLKDRFIRLGIPLILYVIIVNPLILYILYILPSQGISFFEYYLTYFQSIEAFLDYIGGNGPLWFVLMLLILAVCYCILRLIVPKKSEDFVEKKPPRNALLIIICIIMGVLTFLVRLAFPADGGDTILNIQLCFIIQYIIMFILGVEAYKRDWFRNISDSQGNLWFLIVLISLVFFFIIGFLGGAFEGNTEPFRGGFHWQAFAYATWESFYCMGMCIGLITLFRRKYNQQGKVTKNLSQNAYTIYIIHAPVLIFISILFLYIFLPALLKFIIVLPIVLLVCLLISHFILRKIPGAKRVLG